MREWDADMESGWEAAAKLPHEGLAPVTYAEVRAALGLIGRLRDRIEELKGEQRDYNECVARWEKERDPIALRAHEQLWRELRGEGVMARHFVGTRDILLGAVKAVRAEQEKREESLRRRIEELERPGVIPADSEPVDQGLGPRMEQVLREREERARKNELDIVAAYLRSLATPRNWRVVEQLADDLRAGKHHDWARENVE